jgi:tripartite-type tricarboxylate transporter receptor subunit TctC
VLPAINTQLGYDTKKDLSGIALTSVSPMWVLVSPELRVNSMQEFIAYAKSRPDGLNYSSAGVGSLMHFGAELFKVSAGITAQHVPYRGPSEALTDAITGRVQFAISPIGAASEFVKDGKLIALGVTGPSRLTEFPDVPTMTEAGLPAFEVTTWTGLLAPARTPPAILLKINSEIVSVLGEPDVQSRWKALGLHPGPSTPEGFDKIIADDIDAFSKAARQANIQTR